MKQLKEQTVTEVIQKIDSVLTKSRGLLSNDDVQLLEEVKFTLLNLDQLTPEKAKLKLSESLVILLRVFMHPDAMKTLHQWLHEILDKV